MFNLIISYYLLKLKLITIIKQITTYFANLLNGIKSTK